MARWRARRMLPGTAPSSPERDRGRRNHLRHAPAGAGLSIFRNAMADQVPIPLDLFDRLRQAGLDVDAILRRAKLPRSRFSVPKPQGTTAEFFALWRAVEEESDDPGLGLRIGVEALPDEENVVSLAAMPSATLGEGLQKLARYKRLVCPERISIDLADGEAPLRFEARLA